MNAATMKGTTGELADRRKEKGHTQESLATDAGVSVRTVSRAERGDKVSANSMSRIASVLDLDDAPSEPTPPPEPAKAPPGGPALPFLARDDFVGTWWLVGLAIVCVAFGTGIFGQAAPWLEGAEARAGAILGSVVVVVLRALSNASERHLGASCLTMFHLLFGTAMMVWLIVLLGGVWSISTLLMRGLAPVVG